MTNESSRVARLNYKDFRNYWIRRLQLVEENLERLNELECTRKKKKIFSMLQHLDQMEEKDTSSSGDIKKA